MSQLSEKIANNVAAIRERIVDAAKRSGRNADEVTLVAITKYVGLEETKALIDAGCLQLGESRPQSLWEKADAFSDNSVHWHLIGHLQTNKIKRTLPLISTLHSGDRIKLLKALNKEAESANLSTPSLPIYLEVNISGDTEKHGFQPDDLEKLLPEIANFHSLQVIGLMGMAARQGGIEIARKNFESLRLLRDRLLTNLPENVDLSQLSMGMSGDFEVAIEEGSTAVRIGSSLFEGCS
ncbi:YggS family pyridoxal phosphate-dependent enzyme [Planctomycetales bacterium 10988]|nr:YggS family pyridoxal phosphate-dependent enzyme [Planctomycetales bacterium 10988]